MFCSPACHFSWTLLLPLYLIIEAFIPLSVVPLTTPVCAMLCALGGYRFFKEFNVTKRITIVVLLSSLVLATEHVDWNSQKPLIRDLYKVKSGITAAEAIQIMQGHFMGTINNSVDDERLTYFSERGRADIATIILIDGRVASVHFSGD